MRADRLLSLLLLLQTRGRMTAHDLADRLEVSERTIYRDLAALSAAGIPVYTESGPGGGCALLDGYQTRLTGLTEAEVRALSLLPVAGLVAALGMSQEMERARLKLIAALPEAARQVAQQVQERILFEPIQPPTPAVGPYLHMIQQALWHNWKLWLTYREANLATGDVEVEPYGLVAQAGEWYLVGQVAGVLHSLDLRRIQTVHLMAEPFARPADFDLAAYWAQSHAQGETRGRGSPAALSVRPQGSPPLLTRTPSPVQGHLAGANVGGRQRRGVQRKKTKFPTAA
jgi:predicted DNA-binding transcriptional regulator YafY